MKNITNVDFYDPSFFNIINDEHHQEHNNALNCLFLLAICHDIIINDKNGEITYSASSPDEMAIVNFTRYCGVFFKGIDEENNFTIEYKGKTFLFKKLYNLEFNSIRKR